MRKCVSWFLKNAQVTFPSPKFFERPIVTQANLDLVSAKVLAACDALDGVKDGVLDDPRECRFRLATVKACPAKRAGADCLTAAQRAAIARVYAPVTDKRGRVVCPGQPFGGENLPGGWSAWITGSDTGLMRRMRLPNAQVMFLSEAASISPSTIPPGTTAATTGPTWRVTGDSRQRS